MDDHDECCGWMGWAREAGMAGEEHRAARAELARRAAGPRPGIGAALARAWSLIAARRP